MNMFLLFSFISARVLISHTGANGIKTFLNDKLEFDSDKKNATELGLISINDMPEGSVVIALDGNYILEVNKEGQVIKTAFNNSSNPENDISKLKSVSIDKGEESIVFKEIFTNTADEINIAHNDKCLIIGPGRKLKIASKNLCGLQNSKFKLETVPEKKTDKKPEEQKKAPSATSTEKNKKGTTSKPGKGEIEDFDTVEVESKEPKQNKIKRKNAANSTGSTENINASIEALNNQFKELLNKEDNIAKAVKDIEDKINGTSPTSSEKGISVPNGILSNVASGQNVGNNKITRPLGDLNNKDPTQLTNSGDSNTPKGTGTDKLDAVLDEVHELNKKLSSRPLGVGNLPNIQAISPASSNPQTQAIPSASNQPSQQTQAIPSALTQQTPSEPIQQAQPVQAIPLATNQQTPPAPIQQAQPVQAIPSVSTQPTQLSTIPNPPIIPLQGVGSPQSNSTPPNIIPDQGATSNDPNDSPATIGGSLTSIGKELKTNAAIATKQAVDNITSTLLLTLLANAQRNPQPNPNFGLPSNQIFGQPFNNPLGNGFNSITAGA